jgi:periplasmic copper chaperone A
MPRPWFVDLGLVVLVAAVLCHGRLASTEDGVTVSEAWGPSMPPVAPMGAFYMRIHNTGHAGERLRGARSPACSMLELHESYQKPGSVRGMNAMGMRPVPGGVLDIPAQSQVELKASGFHLMCLGKRLALAKGAQFPLTLLFEMSGEVTVPVHIREP